jgi:hypothetical protein
MASFTAQTRAAIMIIVVVTFVVVIVRGGSTAVDNRPAAQPAMPYMYRSGGAEHKTHITDAEYMQDR